MQTSSPTAGLPRPASRGRTRRACGLLPCLAALLLLLLVPAPAHAIEAVGNVTATPGDGQVDLSWTNPASGDFDHVNIYRLTDPFGAPTLVQTVASPGTSWTDTTVVNGTDYWYVLRAATSADVEAVDAASGSIRETWYTYYDFATVRGARFVPTIDYTGGGANPFGQTTSFGARWEGYVYVPVSETYTFYLNHDDTGRLWVDGALVINVGCCGESSVGVALSPGWHELRAELDQGGSGWYQQLSWSSSTIPKEIIPATNLGVERQTQATPTDASLTVTAPNGGEVITDPETTVAWTVTGAVSRIEARYSLDGGATWGGEIDTSLPGASTSVEWGPPAGVRETDAMVRIQAFSAAGVLLASDTSDANFTLDTPPVEPVTDVTATPGDGQVQLDWTNPTDPQFDHVAIYRSTSSGDVGALVHVTPDAVTTSWVDGGVTNGTRYHYRVRAVDAGGREGPSITAGQHRTDGWAGTNISTSTWLGSRLDTDALSSGFGSPDSIGPFANHSPDWMSYDSWSGRWSGLLYVPEAGEYHFHATRRSGARITVNGTQLLDLWYINNNYYAHTSSSIVLPAGWVPFSMEFVHSGGDATASFYWKPTSAGAWNIIAPADMGYEHGVEATPTADTITVTAPNGGESYSAQRRETISWTTTGTDASAVSLWYSLDDGTTYPYLIVRNQPLSGSYDWLVPDRIASATVRVRALAETATRTPIAEDGSDAPFSIDTSSAPPPPVTEIDATPGSGIVALSWTAPAPLGSTDHYRIYRAPDEHSVPELVHTTADATTTTWTDLAAMNGTTWWYYVRSVDATGRENPGLQANTIRAAYYSGQNFDTWKGIVTETSGFEGGRGFGSSDGPAVPDAPDWLPYDSWSARWSGWYYVPETSTYRMRVNRRAGARLWVDGTMYLDQWYTGNNNGYDTYWMHAQLTEGWHHVRLEFTHYSGDAYVYWQDIRESSWSWNDLSAPSLATAYAASATPSNTTITVDAPNGGETFTSIRHEQVSWTTAGTDAASVSLFYSLDGGATWPYVIVRGQPLSGSYDWLIPDGVSSTTVRVRAQAVTAAGVPVVEDASDADFTIDTVSAPPPPVTGVSATPGDGEIQVGWTMPSPLGTTSHVNIYRAPAEHATPELVHSTADTVTTSWTDTTVVNGDRYWYWVRTADAGGRESRSMLAGRMHASYFDGQNFDTFKGRLEETTGFEGSRGWGNSDGPMVFGTAPDWMDYDSWSARWSGYFYAPADDSYRLRVYRRAGARLWVDGEQVLDQWYTGNNNAYDASWMTVQLTEGWHPFRLEFTHYSGDAFLYFQYLRTGDWSWTDVDSTSIAMERTASATPTSATVTVTAPNGGETFRRNARETISWSGAGVGTDHVDLWYSVDGGSTYPYLIARNQVATGSYEWLVPSDLQSAQLRIRAVAVDSTGEWIDTDESDADLAADTVTAGPSPVSAVTATAGDATVSVGWTMPSPLGTVDHVAVYRATSAHDVPTRVHETADSTTTSWTDTGVVNGTRYWYYVRTVDAVGQEGQALQAGRTHATYYDGASFETFKGRVEETVGFEGGRSFGQSDGPVLADAPDWLDYDTWSARWTGYMYVPETTTYRFRVYRRVGARLYIGDRLLLDQWYTSNNNAYDANWMTVQLEQGWHPYRLEFTHWSSDAFLNFQYLRPSAWSWTDVDTASLATERSASTIPNGTAVTITTPDGGETFRAQRYEPITWTTTGTDAADVDLWYSLDGGATWPYLIARDQPLSGTYDWLVPDGLSSTQLRVKAVATAANHDVVTWDTSGADITVETSTAPPPPTTNVQALPSDGQVDVSWTMPSPLGTTDRVRIYRATAPDAQPLLVHETAGTATTAWSDLGVVNGTRYWYYVRTVSADGREAPNLNVGRVNATYWDGANMDTFLYSAVEDYGFAGGRGFGSTDFPMHPEFPGESPGGDTWSARWTGYIRVPETSTYRIRVYRRVGARLRIRGKLLLDQWYTSNNNAYDATWMTIQLEEGWHPYELEFTHWGSDAFLYFQHLRPAAWSWADFGTADVAVERGAAATPNASTVTVTAPDGGEQWNPLREETITWSGTSLPAGTTYRVRYSTDGGATYDRIIAEDIASTSLEWKPPEGLSSTDVRIRVEAVASTGNVIGHDDSDASFTVSAATLPAVTNLTAVAGWEQVELSWTNPVSAQFDHVNVYRTTQPWELGTKVATLAAPTSSWIDTSVTNGTRYWYVVRAATATDDESMTLAPGGLRGDYYDGADFGTFVGSNVDPTVDFNWGAGGPAVLGGTSDNFSVRWSGYVRADADAYWTFDNNRPTRDGTRLWIDGQELINRWNAGDTDSAGYGYMQLQDGWHRITIEYHETTGNAYTALYHARSGLTRRVVPSSELAIEAQADAVPVDPYPPSPDPAGTVTVDSSTQVTWSMLTVIDSESGLDPAGAYTYDNGTTWVTDSSLVRTGLSPNTPYTQTLRARDAYGNMTASNVLTARTLPVAPSVTADKATGTWLGPGAQTITFSNLAVFGAGGVEYYRYAFNTSSAHTFDDTETVWNTGNHAEVVSTSGSYYLHVKSYNLDGLSGGTASYGPFLVDADAPQPDPPSVSTSATLDTVTFDISPASDLHSGLDPNAYSFDNGATWGSTLSDAQGGLAANTVATRDVRVRDAIGNVSMTSSVSAATLPVDPGVTSVPTSGATWHPGGTTVSLSSTVAFGPGTLWGYRWRLTADPADPVLDSDPAWTSGTLAVPIATSGAWYINVRSYNSTGTGGNELSLGPFNIDADAPPGVAPTAPSPTDLAPELSWTGVVDGESGLQAYRIYRSTTSGVLGSQVSSVAAGTTTWTDPDVLVDDTTYYYTVQAVDNVGNEQAVGNTQITVVYSSAPPTGSSIDIAGGAGTVATTAVTLNLVSTNAVDMQVSNAPDFSAATWEPFSATKGWTLPAGDGTKSVYARFRNGGGTVSAAVVDTIDLDQTAPTPDPPLAGGTATSATSISWSMAAVTDGLVGLPADPYSFDAGATWQGTNALTETGLSPNTGYSKTVQARDALGNATGTDTATVTTLASAPNITSNPLPDPGAQPRGTTFTFSNLAGWGAGGVEYYRWTWTTNATHVFDGTEAIWGSGTLPVQELDAGTYYMHVQAYNADNVAGQTLTLSPYVVDAPQSQADLEVNIAATQTLSCATTDFTASLLPGDSDDATVACTVTSALAGWNLQVHADSAPLFTDFLDASPTLAAYSAPAAGDAQAAFTVEGAKAEAGFANGTMWRGFAGATDIKVGSDAGTSGGDTITTRVRAELGGSAVIAAGTRNATLTFTINPGT